MYMAQGHGIGGGITCRKDLGSLDSLNVKSGVRFAMESEIETMMIAYYGPRACAFLCVPPVGSLCEFGSKTPVCTPYHATYTLLVYMDTTYSIRALAISMDVLVYPPICPRALCAYPAPAIAPSSLIFH